MKYWGSMLAIACASVAMPAHAATQTRLTTVPGAHLCTLSIPTTDTKSRPKATGFRNEGTTNAYVICAFDSAPGQAALSPGETATDPAFVGLLFSSLDGKPHSFSCTAVNSWPGLYAPMQYVAKTVDINPDNVFTEVDWFPADFGALSHIPASGNFSITCLLPPQVAILFGGLGASEDVGN